MADLSNCNTPGVGLESQKQQDEDGQENEKDGQGISAGLGGDHAAIVQALGAA